MNVQAEGIPVPGVRGFPREVTLSLGAQRRILRLVLVLTDAFVLGLAFRIAFWFRFDLDLTVSPEIVPDPSFYPNLAAVLVPTWILILLMFNLYDLFRILGGVSEYARIFNACTTATMLVVLATFIVPEFVVSRFFVIGSWGLTFVLLSLSRFVLRRFVYWLRPKGYLLVPSVLVGTNEEARTLAEDLSEWRYSGLRVLGFVNRDGGAEQPVVDGQPVLGSIRAIREVIGRYGIEDVIVSVTALTRRELLRLCEEVNELRDVHLRLSSGLYELLTTRVQVRTLGSVPLISLSKIRLEPEEVYLKTLLEYLITGTALVVLSPLLLAIAILIKLDSPGPVLHRRRVLGVSGRTFDAFKFRTMCVNGDELLGNRPDLLEELRQEHKLREDPRITKIGKWLRKYSLDELPQLFNVLRGQMGLVGPRMISPEEARKYGRKRLNLLTVKPGLTGLWQVSGRSDLSYDDRVRLDMYYIRNYSVWLDLQILFIQTIPAVIRGNGAY